jgi:hypothetical protein
MEKKLNRAGQTTTALFLVGIVLIGIGFTKVYDAKIWFLMGGLAWDAAYFTVLVDNLVRKIPVRTQGGLVRYKDGIFWYFFPYLIMFIFGAFFLIFISISLIVF